MLNSSQVIDFFGMKPLPQEGGFYVETYRAMEQIAKDALPERYSGPRNFGTAILFLLDSESVSKLHRLLSNEIFHFYMGSPVTMLLLFPDGLSKVITLGSDIMSGQSLQVIVPNDVWMGCMIEDKDSFALMGTTVAPGFEFDDFKTADREELLKQYPSQKDLILKLT